MSERAIEAAKKAISEIPASGGGVMELYPATLRNKLSSEMIDTIARAALAAADRVAEKRAPVQGYSAGIPWSMHLRAYDAYCKRYGPQEALINLEGRNCRGGFGTGELDMFIPGWRDELSRIKELESEIERLRAALAAAGDRTGVPHDQREPESLTPKQFVDAIFSACDASNWDADLKRGDWFKGARAAYEQIHQIASDYQEAMYAWTKAVSPGKGEAPHPINSRSESESHE